MSLNRLPLVTLRLNLVHTVRSGCHLLVCYRLCSLLGGGYDVLLLGRVKLFVYHVWLNSRGELYIFFKLGLKLMSLALVKKVTSGR